MWNPRIAMKEYLTICVAAGLLAFSSQAQDSTPAPVAASPVTEAPRIATAGLDDQAYVALLKSEVELNTQFKLLSSLAQEHGKRAEQASAVSQAQKTLWEFELTKELRDRSEIVLQQLSEATKQRQAFEQAHKSTAASPAGLNAVTAETRVSPQEVEFMSKLGERIDRVAQELLATRQYALDYAEKMRTNTLTYDFQKAAAEFEQNARKIKQLEHEQSDLELRKLEFQALRRP
jgi:hypothetical protein